MQNSFKSLAEFDKDIIIMKKIFLISVVVFYLYKNKKLGSVKNKTPKKSFLLK